MAVLKQITMFAYESVCVTKEPKWMEDYDENHSFMYQVDAEALVEDLNRIPSGKGSWIRCLEVDHSRSYESQFKDWDACVWCQNGIGVKKMVKHTGEVMDCIDPHPYRWHYLDGKQIRPWKYEQLIDAWIKGDTLHFKTDSGEYLVEIRPDSEIDRYNRHPYDPSFDLEHFAIECYRYRLPREMMTWRNHYMYATAVLSPFIRNISCEDAKKIDLMGNVPNSLIRNPEFDQICECAERIGIQLKLSYDVPVLENLAMYPVERNCRSCLRRNSSNRPKDSSCHDGKGNCCCSSYMLDRKTPARTMKQKKKPSPSFD